MRISPKGKISFDERETLLLIAGSGPRVLRAVRRAWEDWNTQPEKPHGFQQDTPMMQVVSIAQSIKMEVQNIQKGRVISDALQRIAKQADDLLKISALSAGDCWKGEDPNARTITIKVGYSLRDAGDFHGGELWKIGHLRWEVKLTREQARKVLLFLEECDLKNRVSGSTLGYYRRKARELRNLLAMPVKA